MGFLKRRLDAKVAPHLPTAVAFVKKFYGLTETIIPKLEVGGRETDSNLQLLDRIDSALMVSGSCDLKGTIHITPRKLLGLIEPADIASLLVHEAVHCYVLRTLLGHQKENSPTRSEPQMAAIFADEGLATLADGEYYGIRPWKPPWSWKAKQEQPSTLMPKKLQRMLDDLEFKVAVALERAPGKAINLLMKLCFATLEPRIFVVRQIWQTQRDKIPKETREKLVKRIAILKEIEEMILFSQRYELGVKFVRHVRDVIGDAPNTYSLICNRPPHTMAEVLDPKVYLSRVSVEIERIKTKASACKATELQ